jgi:hypothetical protein
MHFVIKSSGGAFWQASKGFVSPDIRDATKYYTHDDALGARAFCVPVKFASEIVECPGDVAPLRLPVG